jgi:hypothetical protein
MPKFIGNTIPGSLPLDGTTDGYVLLAYSQARLLPARCVFFTLNTSDKGSRGSYAKRWHNWWATADAIAQCPRSTVSMRARAMRSMSQSLPTA